jgi:hypothetical protein
MGKRDSQRERWALYGLITRKQDHPKGQGGSITVEGSDTYEREAIIQDALDRKHTYRQVASELLLRGYDLYKAAPLRRFLRDYASVQRVLEDPFQRRDRRTLDSLTTPQPPQAAAQAKRAHIRRSVTALDREIRRHEAGPDGAQGTALQDFLSPLEDMLCTLVAGHAGVLPATIRGVEQSPALYPAQGTWQAVCDALGDPALVTDARILQGLADGREAAAAVAPYIGAAVFTQTGVSPEEQARRLLLGHACAYEHTLGQAFIPMFTLMAIFSPEELEDLPTSEWALHSLLGQADVRIGHRDPGQDDITVLGLLKEWEDLTGTLGS